MRGYYFDRRYERLDAIDSEPRAIRENCIIASGGKRPAVASTRSLAGVREERPNLQLKGEPSRTLYPRLSALNAHFAPSAPLEEIESDRFPRYLICYVILINRRGATCPPLEVNGARIETDAVIYRIDKSVMGGAGRDNGAECRRGRAARRSCDP
ncbi:unnamed protein product, partial [Iphiclides podalirius]